QQHRINAFEISSFPVTNREFERYFPNHVRALNTPDDDHPVVEVTYFEALEFCRRANMRLPSAVEWEVAARGESNLACANSIEPSHDLQNFFPSAGPNKKGAYPPNDRGLFDMTGNVLELTSTSRRWQCHDSFQKIGEVSCLVIPASVNYYRRHCSA
ncbi:MAG: hypothetical protein EBZ48_12345, partial [Proteobacteria bacterium]|nr:hypothetical protein [Pseudomonadota bacterium]